ncbi:unnamed protein product, partial [Ectocarpus sp. 8 AP-2014]
VCHQPHANAAVENASWNRGALHISCIREGGCGWERLPVGQNCCGTRRKRSAVVRLTHRLGGTGRCSKARPHQLDCTGAERILRRPKLLLLPLLVRTPQQCENCSV